MNDKLEDLYDFMNAWGIEIIRKTLRLDDEEEIK